MTLNNGYQQRAMRQISGKLPQRLAVFKVAMLMLLSQAATSHAEVLQTNDKQLNIVLAQLPSANQAQLQIELDGYDVSAFASLQNNQLQLNLPVALEPGAHQIAVLAFWQNGEVSTLLESEFSATGLHRTGTVNVLLSSRFRIAESPKESYEGISSDSHQAVFNGTGELRSGSWRHAAQGHVMSADAPTVAGSDAHTHLVNYQLSSAYESGKTAMVLTAGDQQAMNDSLIASGFMRRGLALAATQQDWLLSGQMFVGHALPVTATADGVILPDTSDEQVVGASFSWQPIRSKPQALQLGLSWLDGDSSLTGLATSTTDDTVYGGSAYALQLDSWWWDSSLWLHAEQARSDFDKDGLDQGYRRGYT